MTRTTCLVALALLLAGPAGAQTIVEPRPDAVVGRPARFVVDAPPTARTTVFTVDDVELGRATGPGRHQLEQALHTPGRRTFSAKSYDAGGRLLGVTRASFVAPGLVLRSLGGARVRAENVRLQVVAYGLSPARVAVEADGVPLGELRRAPYLFQRSFSRGGARALRATALDAQGRVLAAAELTLQVVDPELTPPTSRGAIKSYGGARLNDRTVAMLRNAARWLESHGGCPPGRASTAYVTQGSYNRGGVSASAGTHDGGGAIDLSVGGLSSGERHALVRALREAGFAAWLRKRPTFSSDHVHAIAIGDPDLPAGARDQVADYFAGRDGLAGHGKDPHGGPIVKAWMARFGAPSRGLAGVVGR